MGGIIVILSTCLILKIVKFCSFLRGKWTMIKRNTRFYP
jgi:hypothetical protein